VKALAEWTADELRLVLEDVGAAFEPAVRDLAFTQRRERYVRAFPRDARGAEAAASRFPAAAIEMVEQAAGMQPVPWERALEALLERLGGTQIDWWLTGSAALAVRGLDIEPRDLDVIVEPDAADTLGNVLEDALVEPVTPGGFLGERWGRAFLEARIEWVGGVHPHLDEPEPTDFGPEAAGRLDTVVWRGRPVRVPPLELQLAVTERRGLGERADLIRKALDR
jgi:hypothetical protein